MAEEKTTLRCSSCREWKPVAEFYPEPSRKSRGYSYHCTPCKLDIAHTSYAKKNPGATKLGRRGEPTFDRLEYSKRYRQANYGQYAAAAAKRRAQILQATPPWFEEEAVAQLYKDAAELTEMTGIQFHVDHIIPLQNDKVCGLHCLENLQILIWSDNLAKNNKF